MKAFHASTFKADRAWGAVEIANMGGITQAGDVLYDGAGTEHVAHPVGKARVVMVERAGSI